MVEVKASGNATVSTGNPEATQGAWTPADWTAGVAGGGTAASNLAGPGSASAMSSGSVDVRLRWTGDPTTATSPTWVQIASNASWSATQGSGNADDGLGDQPKGNSSGRGTNGGGSVGKHVYRHTGGSVWTMSVSPSANASSPMSGVSAACSVSAALTDKNASLSRGGGDIPIEGNAYTGNTLLSWNDADGVEPGPNYQSLTGTYGGTWTKLSDGTTDNVNITWSGATLAGGLGFAPIAGQDHHTTTYPASATGGKMPTADGSGSKMTQDWKYSVQDNVDGSEIDLTFQWICHYAYEKFVNTAVGRTDAVTYDTVASFSGTGVHLTNANPSGSSHLSKTSYTTTTDFDAPDASQSLPGFIPHGKHIGIPTFLSHLSDSHVISWPSDINETDSLGDGTYSAVILIKNKTYHGYATVWNSLGLSGQQTLSYHIGDESDKSIINGFTPDPST